VSFKGNDEHFRSYSSFKAFLRNISDVNDLYVISVTDALFVY